jgi:hypothetical protein
VWISADGEAVADTVLLVRAVSTWLWVSRIVILFSLELIPLLLIGILVDFPP